MSQSKPLFLGPRLRRLQSPKPLIETIRLGQKFIMTARFNNATINLSAGAGMTVEQVGSVLTLGSGALIQGSGGVAGTQFISGGAVSLINQGILRGNVSGQTLTIGFNNVTLTNAAGATIEAVNGATVTIGATALTSAPPVLPSG